MAEVLVLVKPAEGRVGKSTLEALTIARGLGEPAAVVVGAPGLAASLQDRLAEFGAAKIYAAESDELGDYLVTPKVAVLEQLARSVSPAAIVIPSTQEGKEVAGRLAVRLDNGVLTDVVGLDADGTATQVAFAGSTIVKSKVTRGIPLVTVRPNSLTPTLANVHRSDHRTVVADPRRRGVGGACARLETAGLRPDYFHVVDADSLLPASPASRHLVLLDDGVEIAPPAMMPVVAPQRPREDE